jgi:hypothetical protein
MRFPAECYQMLDTIDAYFAPCLRPAQRRGLVYWVYGTILAKSALQNAVITALMPVGEGSFHSVRQYVREWLYDGQDRAAPCQTQVDIQSCFAPLLRWLLSLWQGEQLVLAIDVTNLGDRLHALCVSVLYRSCAIPVAWHLMPGGEKGAWLPHLCRLLHTVGEVVPARFQVLVLMDAGLRSPALWDTCEVHGWHPVQRHDHDLFFRPAGYREFHRAASLVRTPGQAWIGTGVAFKSRTSRRPATLVVVWGDEEAAEPWVLLTEMAPADVGLTWYGLRIWIELGFRALKGMGWQWQKSRRIDPERVARHWLVMAVASCWVLALGTRAEDAAATGHRPASLLTPPLSHPHPASTVAHPRLVSVFARGLAVAHACFRHNYLWRRLWLTPDPWPGDPPHLTVTRHPFAPEPP